MEPPITNSEPPVAAKNVLHQVTPFSKYLAMALFITMPFVGGYIGYSFAPEKVVEVEKEVVVTKPYPIAVPVSNTRTDIGGVSSVAPTTTFSGQLRNYEDKTLGIAFQYPYEWGVVTGEDEPGNCPSEYQSDSCMQRILGFSNAANIFLASETRGHEQYPVGRGGFWGDSAGTVSSEYLDQCRLSADCDVVLSGSGVTFARYNERIFDWQDTEESKWPLHFRYELYRADNQYYGTIASTVRMGESNKQLFEDTVIKTFRYIE